MAALPTSSPTGGAVYWVGQDGNIWLKGSGGTSNAGPAAGSTLTGTSFSDPWADKGATDPTASITNATQIQDPSTQGKVLGDITSGGSTVTPGFNDPGTIAGYGQDIANLNTSLGLAPQQLASGNATADASYTNAINQLLGGKTTANNTYTTNKNQDSQSYISGKNSIGANAGNTLNGLLRLLGSRGAGGSTDATIVAPGDIARQATQQRNDLGNTFGTNESALDTNWNTYMDNYNKQVTNAGTQRDNSKITNTNSVNTNSASIDQQIAALQQSLAIAQGGNGTAAAQPYLDAANRLLAGVASNPAGATATPFTMPTYGAPNLSAYTTNPNAAPTFNGTAASNDYTSPALAGLLGKQKLPNNVGA